MAHDETSASGNGIGRTRPCPECGGNGLVVVLTSSRPCRRCGGTGLADAGPGAEAGGPDPCVRTYDEQGRIVRAVWPDGRTDSYSYYGDEVATPRLMSVWEPSDRAALE